MALTDYPFSNIMGSTILDQMSIIYDLLKIPNLFEHCNQTINIFMQVIQTERKAG